MRHNPRDSFATYEEHWHRNLAKKRKEIHSHSLEKKLRIKYPCKNLEKDAEIRGNYISCLCKVTPQNSCVQNATIERTNVCQTSIEHTKSHKVCF